MKKHNILLLFLFFSSLFAKAQYYEGFENGVPGSMLQEILVKIALQSEVK